MLGAVKKLYNPSMLFSMITLNVSFPLDSFLTKGFSRFSGKNGSI